MVNELWINLPVDDMEKAYTFYKSIGFEPSGHGLNHQMSGFVVGRKNMILMLHDRAIFNSILGHSTIQSPNNTQMILSLDFETIEEVDCLADKVWEAGGTLFTVPTFEQEWMYGFGFLDPDGHSWVAINLNYQIM